MLMSFHQPSLSSDHKAAVTLWQCDTQLKEDVNNAIFSSQAKVEIVSKNVVGSFCLCVKENGFIVL